MNDVCTHWHDDPTPGSHEDIDCEKKLQSWLWRFQHGWRRNRRLRQFGADDAIAFYGVGSRRYFTVLWPAIIAAEKMNTADDERRCATVQHADIVTTKG